MVKKAIVEAIVIVEQAIFTSARTQRLDGYQVVAASPGVSTKECRSLAQWCPAHDSLADPSEVATSVNFHPLAGKRYCVSRTSIAGAEYSGRGGGRVLTHCFLLSPQLLMKFSNNPFRVLEAIVASGHTRAPDGVPSRLPSIPLVGRGSTVDRALLNRLLRDAPSSVMASLLAAAVREPSMCIMDQACPDQWLAALFSLVPVICRTQLTFSTGLKSSARRPFHCMTRSQLTQKDRKLLERAGQIVVDTGGEEITPDSCTGWACLAQQMLARDNFSAWERLLRCRMPGLRLEHLDHLAQEMLREQKSGQFASSSD